MVKSELELMEPVGNEEFDTGEQNSAIVDRLTEAGVQVIEYNPVAPRVAR